MKQNNIENQPLKNSYPLIFTVFMIVILLVLSFIYKIYKYPFWIDEGGVIETLSVLAYFLCAVLILAKGGISYIRQYHYFFILIILFGLRELDFDKRFTTMSIFKGNFYFSGNVPITEKLMGILIIAILLYILLLMIKNHLKGFFSKVAKGYPVHIGALLTFALLFFVKSIDGIGRKLGDMGFFIKQQTGMTFLVIEEVLELGIPLLIISSYCIYFSNR